MADCPPNPYNSTGGHVSACEGALDPMNGSVVPDGITAVGLFVNGEVEWVLDPEQPGTVLPTLLVNQSSGGILIQDGLYLAIA